MAERLTPHQRGFLIPLARQYHNAVERGDHDPRLRSKSVGSPSTVGHLIRKGYVNAETVYGPRGGRSYLYTPTPEALALLERVDAPYRGAARKVDEYFAKHHDVVKASRVAKVEAFRPGSDGFKPVPRTYAFTPGGLRDAERGGYTAFAFTVRSVRHGVDVTADFSLGELKRATEEAA